jgi:hypothetical protein
LPETSDLLGDEALHALDALLGLKRKVKLARTCRLIGWVMPHGEVRVLKGTFYRDAFGWVKWKKLAQEIESDRVGLRIELTGWDSGLIRKTADVVLSLLRFASAIVASMQWLWGEDKPEGCPLAEASVQKAFRGGEEFGWADRRNPKQRRSWTSSSTLPMCGYEPFHGI